MTVTVVGIQGIDFTADNGERVAGKKLHCIVEDEQGADVVGKVVKTMFIHENAKFQADNVQIGKTYTAYGEPGKKALAVMIEQK